MCSPLLLLHDGSYSSSFPIYSADLRSNPTPPQRTVSLMNMSPYNRLIKIIVGVTCFHHFHCSERVSSISLNKVTFPLTCSLQPTKAENKALSIKPLANSQKISLPLSIHFISFPSKNNKKLGSSFPNISIYSLSYIMKKIVTTFLKTLQ